MWVEAKIFVDYSQPPKYCKPWSVSYAVKTKVEQEVDRLVSEKVIESVKHSI